MGSYRFSICSDLERLLQDEDFLDVTLEGTDGEVVRASRMLLSARSPVFRSMFCGGFRESHTGAMVKVGYESNIIQALVKFCYTDELDRSTPSEEYARLLVRIATAANYYKIPLLEREACIAAALLMKSHPPLACVIYDHALAEAIPETLSKHFMLASLSVVRWAPERSLLSSAKNLKGRLGVTYLRASTLQAILKDRELRSTELALFKCVKQWVFRQKEEEGRGTLSSSSCSPKSSPRTSPKSEDSPRKTKIKNSQCAERDRITHSREILLKEIDFSRILPSHLEEVVGPTGLLSKDMLYDAYREQAKHAEQGMELRQRCAATRNPLCDPKTRALLVIGAGVEEVNGVYHKEPKDVYKRRGRYDGKECTFVVNWAEPKSKDSTMVIFAGEKPTDTEFYHFYVGEAENGQPSVDEWEKDVDGTDPCPICITLEWSKPLP